MRGLLVPMLALLALAGLPACHRAPPPPYPGGTVSKLKVINKVAGSGTVAKPGMELVVQYTGWLYDEHAPKKRGKEFDSTREHNDTPFRFMLGTHHVIEGWNRGLEGMHVGGVRVLMIPPDLAYGSHSVGVGTIPANASLVFRIKLLDAQVP
jgi:FKBP-type peptidyl-prolyl cis-trans isomerase FkpA